MIEHTFQHYLLGLFAVANNISAIAPFLVLCAGLSRTQSLRLIMVSSIGSFVIMTISMLFGASVLAFFGISISAFQIAGGILLCGAGMSMLNSKSNNDVAGKQVDVSPAEFSAKISQIIVPITMPLTTGAGTISTVTLFSDEARRVGTMPDLFAAICVMVVIIFAILYFAMDLMKFLGSTGMNVLVKVMGLFTLAIGVQFMVTGISTIYKQLIGA